MSDFPNEFSYESSRSKLDTETYSHKDFINLIDYINRQRQQAEDECRWYFLIDLSKVNENIKKCFIQKMMSRYPNIYYRYGESHNQYWTPEIYKKPSFDPRYCHNDSDIYSLFKLEKINDCLRKNYFFVSMDNSIDATKYGWPIGLKISN